MNINELKVFIVGIVAFAITLIVLISCVTYYNNTQLKSELISSGKPTSTVLYVYKLDDEQFSKLVEILKNQQVKEIE